MTNKNFIDIIEECDLSVNKDMIIEVQLCPDCETEVSKYNNNYLCPSCGCLKTSCITRKITINKSNNNIKNKKFEFIAVYSDSPKRLDDFGKIGYEMCGIVKTEIEDDTHQTTIYMQREILDNIEQTKHYDI